MSADLEFLKRVIKDPSHGQGTHKVHQMGSGPGPHDHSVQSSATEPAIATTKPTTNICYLSGNLIDVSCSWL